MIQLASKHSPRTPAISRSKSENEKGGNKRKREAENPDLKRQAAIQLENDEEENSLDYWKMLAKAFNCDDACSSDEADMMDELLHLCSWFEQSYGIDAEQDEQSDEDDSYIRSLMREDAQKRLQVPLSKNSKIRLEKQERIKEREKRMQRPTRKAAKRSTKKLTSEESMTNILRMNSLLRLDSRGSSQTTTTQSSSQGTSESFSREGSSQLLAGAFCGVFATELDNAHFSAYASVSVSQTSKIQDEKKSHSKDKDKGDFWGAVEF